MAEHDPPRDLHDPRAGHAEEGGRRALGALVGGTGPPLVAVHGGMAGGRLTFGGVLPDWSRRYQVILPDRPGFQRTGGHGDVEVGEQADRLAATVEAHCEGPCHVLGFSVGGLVVLRAMQERPELFTTATLVETPALDLCPSDMVEPAHLHRLVQQIQESSATDTAALEAFFTVVDPPLWAAMAPLLAGGDAGLTPLRADLVMTARLDRLRLAHAVSDVPPIGVLAVSGTTSAAAFRSFGACIAAALMGRHVVIEGAGHAAHLHPRFAAVLDHHTGVTG